MLWVEAVGLNHHPNPWTFCTLPSFTRIKRPRWQPVDLNNQHLRYHRKLGECERSSFFAWYTCIFRRAEIISLGLFKKKKFLGKQLHIRLFCIHGIFWEAYSWKQFALCFKNVWVDVICKPFPTLEGMMHLKYFRHTQECCT